QEPADPVEFVLANSGLPERAKAWLRKHPEYLLDQEKNAELQFHHFKARREAEEFSDGYYGVLERHLGLSNGQAKQHENHIPSENVVPPSPPRPSAPVNVPPRNSAPQQRTSVSYSAPPTREAPSMRTGRPVSYRAPLSQGELDVAASLGISPQEYAQQKEKMLRLKQSGEMQ